jgi:PAS domain S-box-containing protein
VSDVLTGPIDAVWRRTASLRERAAREPSPALHAETIEILDCALAALQEAEQELGMRKQADEVLRCSEARFRQVLESDIIGVIYGHADGRVTYANDYFLRMLGLTREDLQSGSLRWKDLTPPEYAEADAQAIAQAGARGVGGFYEKEFFRRDGNRVPVLVGYGVLDDSRDEGVVFVLDITARKRAEQGLLAAKAELETRVAERTAALARANEALQRELSERLQAEAAQRESEERFAKAFQHAPVGMALADASGRLFLVNDALCKLFGYSQQEFLGKSARDLLHPDDLPAWLADRRRLAAGEIPSYHSERRYIHKSGHTIIGQTGVAALRGPDGTVAGYVIQWRDISAQKQATEALRRSEERLALAMAGARDGLWDWDIETGEGYLSPRWKSILGFEEHEIAGHLDEWASRLHPEDAERVHAAVNAHLEGRTDHFECEYRIRHKDGSYRWVISRALAVRDASGNACRVAGSMTDITERKHAGQALKNAHAELATISQILRALNAHLDVSAAFPDAMAGLSRLAGCALVGLSVFDENREWMTLIALDEPLVTLREGGARLRMADVAAAPDVLAGRSHVVPDLAAEIEFPGVRAAYEAGYRSFVSLPLRGRDDVFGMLTLSWRQVGASTTANLSVLSQVADALAMAVEKTRLFEQVRIGRVQLQGLSRRLMELQETERRHLASELHDEIGQTLTAVKLMFDNLVRLPRTAAEQQLEETKQLVDDLLQRVRDLSLALRPAMLDDLGVLPALVWLFDRYTAQTGITVAFEHRGLERRFPPDLETAMYRIVQEALTNVARHAGVTDVTVEVWPEDGVLRVRIADEGVGFDADAALAAGTSGGLAGMRERALLLGGSLTIQSAPGHGTTVSALLPNCGAEPGPNRCPRTLTGSGYRRS